MESIVCPGNEQNFIFRVRLLAYACQVHIPDELIDKMRAGHWYQVHPKRLAQYYTKRVRWISLHLCRCFPCLPVGNMQRIDANTDRMAIVQSFLLHRNWNTKCREVQESQVPDAIKNSITMERFTIIATQSYVFLQGSGLEMLIHVISSFQEFLEIFKSNGQ